MTAEDFVDQILAAYAARGGERYGERVTQLDHALQCAHLAAAEGAPEALVLAALLHDYGHLIENRGARAEERGVDGEHEALGAATLSLGFDAAVTRPIALHVAAKRYLCAAEPGYFESLSSASRLSLDLQGGVFSAAEATAFAALPHAPAATRLRRWDDDGKVVDMADAPPLASYREMMLRHAHAPR
ncbi:MAG TPA: metal-dependent phosphohydrolase [Caulobacteraceae bacterium]|jgi:phosphonate degradation associated HDIG domain protein|nr:metal-dependent phosphohydrolase [Caulobacteraceae bacterium]